MKFKKLVAVLFAATVWAQTTPEGGITTPADSAAIVDTAGDNTVTSDEAVAKTEQLPDPVTPPPQPSTDDTLEDNTVKDKDPTNSVQVVSPPLVVTEPVVDGNKIDNFKNPEGKTDLEKILEEPEPPMTAEEWLALIPVDPAAMSGTEREKICTSLKGTYIDDVNCFTYSG